MQDKEVEQSIEKARQMVSDLCLRKREWLMSIPAQPNYDPDIVIADALRLASRRIQQLEAQLEIGAKLDQPIDYDKEARVLVHNVTRPDQPFDSPDFHQEFAVRFLKSLAKQQGNAMIDEFEMFASHLQFNDEDVAGDDIERFIEDLRAKVGNS